MSRMIIGKLDLVRAVLDAETLYLMGVGINPSSGWTNQFHPDLSPERTADFVFYQIPPCGIVLPVMLPFTCVGSFPGAPFSNAQSIRVRYKKDNTPFVDTIPVYSTLTASDRFVVLQQDPIQIYPAEDPRILSAEPLLQEYLPEDSETKLKINKKTIYRRVIAGYDNPFDCWFRGSRNEWILEVVTASEQDIKNHVETCLRDAAIGSALALIVS
ncbi:MAG: hypothetical protein LDL27_02050, partial [Desulfovibrio sp.]|nr:hypothetical protein [Desulfovibrio sp.]